MDGIVDGRPVRRFQACLEIRVKAFSNLPLHLRVISNSSASVMTSEMRKTTHSQLSSKHASPVQACTDACRLILVDGHRTNKYSSDAKA